MSGAKACRRHTEVEAPGIESTQERMFPQAFVDIWENPGRDTYAKDADASAMRAFESPERPLGVPEGMRDTTGMQAVRLFTTVGDELLQALPGLTAFRGRRVEVLVLEEPAAATVPATAAWGFLSGGMSLKADFDAPLPDDMQQAFEGGGS